MADKFTLRQLPDGEPTGRLALDDVEMRLGTRLNSRTGGPFAVRVDGGAARQAARMLGVLNRVHDAFRDGKAERVVVNPAEGPSFALKRFEEPKEDPIIDTPGTKKVDIIYTALHRRFDPEFLVRDMGICVNKPGEHGECNAADFGTDANLGVTETRRRLMRMAEWLREQGLRNDAGDGGLPVFGIIVLDKFWKTGMGRTWGDYTGTFHAVHLHTNGKPSITGFI